MSIHTQSFRVDPTRTVLGVMLTIELHRRATERGEKRTPAPLRRMGFDDAGYCIDAPAVMPAGGCESVALDAIDLVGWPMTVTREGEDG